jgi:hypothetical protein
MLAIAAVVLVDLLGAAADVSGLGFHFGWRGPLLLAICAGAGFLGGRVASVRAATMIGLVSGAVDAGIAVTWMTWEIDVGRLPDTHGGSVLAIAVGIVAFAGVFGALGGLLARSTAQEAAV